MHKPLPKLEPLVDDLRNLNIGEFLKSTEFKRFCIEATLDEYWRSVFDHVERTRRHISVGFDHKKHDSLDALNLLLNDLYENYSDQFHLFIEGFLYKFSLWTTAPLNTSQLVEDLILLKCPDKTIKIITSLDTNNSTSVPKSEVPKVVDNSAKLELCINKMDESIRNSEFNLTLTYAYSSLEGIFKAYISAKIPSEKNLDELSKVSKIVKEHLKKHFQENEESFPEPMLNLISTITSAVSNARNNFSESHFGNDSDKRLAEFARDCTNSVGRLILKFLE